MESVMLIGIDLGKHSFHVHGQDRQGKTLLRKRFSRPQLIAFLATFHPCTIVMEACAGARFIARQLAGFGHEVKLISPQFVRPFVKSNKNDFLDAEAICEAASRPSMRFVTPRNEAQQTLSALHRVRESLVRERVRASNQIPRLSAGVRYQLARRPRGDQTLAFRAGRTAPASTAGTSADRTDHRQRADRRSR